MWFSLSVLSSKNWFKFGLAYLDYLENGALPFIRRIATTANFYAVLLCNNIVGQDIQMRSEIFFRRANATCR